MSARAQILEALRGAAPLDARHGAPRAAVDSTEAAVGGGETSVDDFVAAVERAAGRCHVLGAGRSVAELVGELLPGSDEVRAADGLWPPTDARTARHDDSDDDSRGDNDDGGRALATLDVTVARAHFGVVENGALWVDGGCGVPRAALWLCKHLVLVVDRGQLLSDMHAAYARLSRAPMPDFGAFISGPSKTADIEQCLVIGAHGPLSLDVVLV